MSKVETSIKVVLLGATMVGKTSLVRREMSGIFDLEETPTIGACFTTKSILIDDETVKVQIWDTAGQERFRSLAPMYYHNAEAAILVYAINDAKSFEDLASWAEELQKNMNPMPFVWVVGNKSDLESARTVSIAQGDEYASKFGAEFLETSAKNGDNVENLFSSIADKARRRTRQAETTIGVAERAPPPQRGCC